LNLQSDQDPEQYQSENSAPIIIKVILMQNLITFQASPQRGDASGGDKESIDKEGLEKAIKRKVTKQKN
jgi:hypothetical protein